MIASAIYDLFDANLEQVTLEREAERNGTAAPAPLAPINVADNYEVVRDRYGNLGLNVTADDDDDWVLGFGAAGALNGSATSDTIIEGYGDDVLDAGAGIDTLIGEGGNDTLISVDGGDSLDGGAGANRFFIEDTTLNGAVLIDGSFWWHKHNTLILGDPNGCQETLTRGDLTGYFKYWSSDCPRSDFTVVVDSTDWTLFGKDGDACATGPLC